MGDVKTRLGAKMKRGLVSSLSHSFKRPVEFHVMNQWDEPRSEKSSGRPASRRIREDDDDPIWSVFDVDRARPRQDYLSEIVCLKSTLGLSRIHPLLRKNLDVHTSLRVGMDAFAREFHAKPSKPCNGGECNMVSVPGGRPLPGGACATGDVFLCTVHGCVHICNATCCEHLVVSRDGGTCSLSGRHYDFRDLPTMGVPETEAREDGKGEEDEDEDKDTASRPSKRRRAISDAAAVAKRRRMAEFSDELISGKEAPPVEGRVYFVPMRTTIDRIRRGDKEAEKKHASDVKYGRVNPKHVEKAEATPPERTKGDLTDWNAAASAVKSLLPGVEQGVVSELAERIVDTWRLLDNSERQSDGEKVKKKTRSTLESHAIALLYMMRDGECSCLDAPDEAKVCLGRFLRRDPAMRDRDAIAEANRYLLRPRTVVAMHPFVREKLSNISTLQSRSKKERGGFRRKKMPMRKHVTAGSTCYKMAVSHFFRKAAEQWLRSDPSDPEEYGKKFAEFEGCVRRICEKGGGAGENLFMNGDPGAFVSPS